jgi:hypothetical protein
VSLLVVVVATGTGFGPNFSVGIGYLRHLHKYVNFLMFVRVLAAYTKKTAQKQHIAIQLI